MDKIQGKHEIFDIKSHRVITIWKIIEIPIPKSIIKHIEEIVAREKVTSLKFKNRVGVIYDNYWIAGVEYEDTGDKYKDYSEEYQEDEDYTESENYENEYQDEDLEAEEEIDEYELAYLEEDTKRDDHNPVNKGKYTTIQEDQEEIEIPGVNEISDTESASSNIIILERESHPL